MFNIRNVAIAINNEFKNISKRTGLYMEQINVGAEPNDYTGDLIDEALLKVVKNMGTLTDWVIDNVEKEQAQEEYDGYPH